MKIGIMGGTFNPIHTGHLLLAETARTAEGLDKIMFLPSGRSYLKPKGVLSADIRLNMVKEAISDNPFFYVSDMEIKRGGNTYTYETLLELREQAPQDDFYFILGADSLVSIEHWVEPQIIFDNCILLAAVRDDIDNEKLKSVIESLSERFSARIHLLPFSPMTISSTVIRNNIAEGKSIRNMVPEKVRLYIEENRLYQHTKGMTT